MSAHSLEQQVNLFQPILGAEKRLFSARAIAVALSVLALSLIGMGLYGSSQTRRIERMVEDVEQRANANLALTERASAAQRPNLSMEQIDADAKRLSADIEARQRALDALARSGDAPATGFAARLEALARRHMDGIWLSAIIEGSSDGQLAMRGATRDSHLVPVYLGALAQEPALRGVRFDKIAIRRAEPDEKPAQSIFELEGPGLSLEKRKDPK